MNCCFRIRPTQSLKVLFLTACVHWPSLKDIPSLKMRLSQFSDIMMPMSTVTRPLKGIFTETSRLLMTLPSKERALLEQQLIKLEAVLSKSNGLEQPNQELQNLIDLKAAQNGKLGSQLEQRLARIETLLNGKNLNYQELQQLLKNDTIPALRQILQSQSYSDKTYQSVATIIDHIVRYDKANPEQLEAAVMRFSQALKPLSNLTDSEIVDMKNQLFLHMPRNRKF